MFGYVRVHQPELKVKEYEFYRGTYCGLCRAMGRCTGQCSRMTLSYDFAFLALLRLALTEDELSFRQRRCLAHPLKKRNSMEENPTLDYCAGAAAILNYHKLLDDLSDERGWKRFRARLALPWIRSARRRALRSGLSELDERIGAGLVRLAEIETEKRPSVDLPAEVFGEILAEIVSFRLEGDAHRVACAIGRSVGKWIYMADALDDWREDAEKGRYNPFHLLFGGKMPSTEELASIGDALKNELFAAEAAVDLIEFNHTDIKNIVLNILYLGMPKRIDQIAREVEAGIQTEKG